ncbi:MAG: hypothetical protein K6T31_05695 [Alicyclobacillus sp.]|nr:hypothetical protein [Alicyclobacillus sp.]
MKKQIMGYAMAFTVGSLLSGSAAWAATNLVQAQAKGSVVELNGKQLSAPPSLVYGGTTYVQLYSIQNGLQQVLGVRPTWDGTHFNILTPAHSVQAQTESSVIEFNGQTVASPPALVYNGSTYVQLYSLQNGLQQVYGVRPSWDGTHFNVFTQPQTSNQSTGAGDGSGASADNSTGASTADHAGAAAGTGIANGTQTDGATVGADSPQPVTTGTANGSSTAASSAGFTLANYNQIDSTYTVDDVNKLFGFNGTLKASDSMDGGLSTALYEWSNADGDVIVDIYFENGHEQYKAEYGLS